MGLPEVNVAIFAFLLNYPWELLQVPFFEGMATAPHWDAVKFRTGATLGDAGIALVGFWAVAAARSRAWILRPTAGEVISFTAVARPSPASCAWWKRRRPRAAGRRIIALSKATYRKMVQNLWWAAGYNIFAIPLAAGVLQPWGIVLHPAMGAVLMPLSTIIVAINAQLLRRAEL
jgi:hypothetical protein